MINQFSRVVIFFLSNIFKTTSFPKNATIVAYVWLSLKVTSKFNIPGETTIWNVSTWSSRWVLLIWTTCWKFQNYDVDSRYPPSLLICPIYICHPNFTDYYLSVIDETFTAFKLSSIYPTFIPWQVLRRIEWGILEKSIVLKSSKRPKAGLSHSDWCQRSLLQKLGLYLLMRHKIFTHVPMFNGRRKILFFSYSPG